DERRRAFDDLGRSLLAPELFKVWSAVLDRKTCAFCFAKDGQVRGLHESFSASPPVHPNCRCIVELVRVPRPERLEDVGTDYSALKAEIRDVIRERREVSGRHAAAFVTDSMGERRRSPLVLSGRFARMGH
ncbi:MAG: phage minor head protein, partial [Polyangiaceae bacterium]